MRSARLLFTAVCWTVLTGSTLTAQQDLAEADRLTAQLSSDSGVSAAMRRSLHPSGVLLWPGAPLMIGAKEVRKFLDSLPGRDSSRLSWQALGAELSRDSSLGVTWGVALTGSKVAPGLPRLGRYISVWERGEDRWSMAALVLIAVPSVSPAAGAHGIPLSRPPARPSRETAPFINADLAFARLAGDSGAATAFRTWAAEDGMIFGSGGLLIRSPVAIGRAVAGAERWSWHPVVAGAARSGDLGWTVGEAVIASPGAEPAYSKYLTVWVRRGATARFLLDGGNTRPRTP